MNIVAFQTSENFYFVRIIIFEQLNFINILRNFFFFMEKLLSKGSGAWEEKPKTSILLLIDVFIKSSMFPLPSQNLL